MQEELRIKNPFPGLRPFDTSESLVFFGRDGLSDTLLEKLRATRFVAVVGTSGSGKSSLVKAGLLPALAGGFLRGAGSGWRIALFRPVNNPIRNLAQALAEADLFLPGSEEERFDDSRAVIEKALRRSSLGLIDVVRQAKMSPYENLLIVVDQFEELYRFEPSPEVEHPREEASAFVKLLLEATQQDDLPIYVILTMRSDYLGESAHFWGLPEAINKGQFLIPRMDDDEKREAIEGPIRVFNTKISSPLVNRLLNDVGDDPGQLPILQHALMRTWDYRLRDIDDSKPLGLEHYENRQVGGMARALSIHADEAYDELTKDQQVIAEKMFKRLTEKGVGKREGRLPATVGEIAEIAGIPEEDLLPVIGAFRKEGRSFLMPPPPTDTTLATDLTSTTLIDISHESLISGWTRLSEWVEEEADSAKIYGRLVDDALRYPKGTGLLTNPELEFALKWRAEQEPNDVWAKRYRTDYGKALDSDKPLPRPAWAEPEATEFGIATTYLDLSKQEHDRIEDSKESKRRRSLITLSVAAGICLTLALVASVFYRAAARAETKAIGDKQRAEEAQADANRLRETAVSLQRQADQRAVEAVVARENADEALKVAERERASAVAQAAIAAQRGRQLLAFTELGNASDKLIAATETNETQALVHAYQSMRSVYGRRGFFDASKQATLDRLTAEAIFKDENSVLTDAFPYFQRSVKIAGGTDQPRTLALANIKFATKIIESNVRDSEEAIPFLEEGIKGLDNERDTEEKAAAFDKLGDAHAEADNVEKAESAYNKALELLSRRDLSYQTRAGMLRKIGRLFLDPDHKSLEKARAYFEQARVAYQAADDNVGLGNVLVDLAQNETRNVDSAVDFYEQARKAYNVDSTRSPTVEALLGDARALDSMAQLSRSRGDYQTALARYELAVKRYQAVAQTQPTDPERALQRQRARIMMARVGDNVQALKPYVITQILFKTIEEKGVVAGIDRYRDLKKNHASEYVFAETSLNRLGYDLLKANKKQEAIEIFKLNVEEFPSAYNTYDSLADAYVAAENKDLAILNYERSIALNPKNSEAIEKLKKLKSP